MTSLLAVGITAPRTTSAVAFNEHGTGIRKRNTRCCSERRKRDYHSAKEVRISARLERLTSLGCARHVIPDDLVRQRLARAHVHCGDRLQGVAKDLIKPKHQEPLSPIRNHNMEMRRRRKSSGNHCTALDLSDPPSANLGRNFPRLWFP